MEMEDVKHLCSEKVDIKDNDRPLLVKFAIQLLKIASANEISISHVWLSNCYSTVNLSGGNHLQLKSNLSIPALTTLNKLTIREEGRRITAGEFAGILQYSSKCLALKELEFFNCLLPKSVQAESVSVFKSRNVKVYWGPRGFLRLMYQLNFDSGHWQRTPRYGGDVMAEEDYHEEVRMFRRICEERSETKD